MGIWQQLIYWNLSIWAIPVVDMNYRHSYWVLQIKSNVHSLSAWIWCLALENRRRVVREVSQGMIGTRVGRPMAAPGHQRTKSILLSASVGGYWRIRSMACWGRYKRVHGLAKCLKLCTDRAKCKAFVYRLPGFKLQKKCILKSVSQLCAFPGYHGLRPISDYYIKIWMTFFPLDPP